MIENLKVKGAEIIKGHNANNLSDADVLVYSSAVKEDNPEIIAAFEKNIPIIRRAEMLGELIALKETSIGVAGTHGKTSTSSMVGAMLSQAKLDPTLVVGGLVRNINTNSLLGEGDIIVVEADEFDRSFYHYNLQLVLLQILSLNIQTAMKTYMICKMHLLNSRMHLLFMGLSLLAIKVLLLQKLFQILKGQ